jgi:hypothetical protein
MPNELDQKNNGGDDGDEAAKAAADKAAEDKAAADKVAEDAAAGGDEEEVSIKKSELEKIKSDRDNYREGLLKRKVDERNLDNKGKDGDGDGGGKNDGGTIDEAKIIEIAKAQSTAALEGIYKGNESRAKRTFLKNHGEYVDDAQWIEMMSHFSSRRGKATSEDILDDLEDAVFSHKRETGKLDEYLKSEAERARREGRIEGQMDVGRGGDAGDKNEGKDAGTLSPKGEEMSRGMHTDPEKVKKVDPSKDNVIDVTK